MQSVIFPIDERLAEAGDTLPLVGHLDEEGYSLGEHDFKLPEGIDYDLVLTNAGEGILATGMLKTHVVGTCDRCLEDAEFDINGEVDEYFLFEEPAEEDLSDDEDEMDYSLVSPDHTIDLSGALQAALIMETPFVVLCRPDCKGLCPVCGANLNEVDCGHAAQMEEDRLKSSPFAVLANLKLDDDDAADSESADNPGVERAAGGSSDKA
ncbi:MAG: YceD family protein [Tractidigestivibacter sp.]|jgi:uncharacterized protein|uniref:YceD family protein n=1 Tax=Tractidigestivibacter sp. TaxID=2847320 RepID=UPI003D8C3FA6